MKNLVLYLVVIFMIVGCAGATKTARSSDTLPAPKKFDLGEFYFKWVIVFPLEVFVGIPSGALFMTREEVQRKDWEEERLKIMKFMKKEKKRHDLRD